MPQRLNIICGVSACAIFALIIAYSDENLYANVPRTFLVLAVSPHVACILIALTGMGQAPQVPCDTAR